MIHDDFDTQIQSDEDFRAGITDEEWNEMQTVDVENGEIVWSDKGIDVVYYHTTDDFELWVEGCDGWESQSVFNKSADAVKAARDLERYEG